jgi:hypothetical protein
MHVLYKYYIILYCIILYYIVLYYIILCYDILYYIILCHIILYYIILYYILLYRSPFIQLTNPYFGTWILQFEANEATIPWQPQGCAVARRLRHVEISPAASHHRNHTLWIPKVLCYVGWCIVHYLVVSWNRATPSHHPLIFMDFPWNKPSSYWDTSIYGNPMKPPYSYGNMEISNEHPGKACLSFWVVLWTVSKDYFVRHLRFGKGLSTWGTNLTYHNQCPYHVDMYPPLKSIWERRVFQVPLFGDLAEIGHPKSHLIGFKSLVAGLFATGKACHLTSSQRGFLCEASNKTVPTRS